MKHIVKSRATSKLIHLIRVCVMLNLIIFMSRLVIEKTHISVCQYYPYEIPTCRYRYRCYSGTMPNSYANSSLIGINIEL